MKKPLLNSPLLINGVDELDLIRFRKLRARIRLETGKLYVSNSEVLAYLLNLSEWKGA